MSEDLDDLLRAAMKTLDDQVPSGYFEGLPNRTLMRLEDSSMQTTGTSDNSKPTGAPPPEDRDEDSGLHDIRSMASSTKMRISSKRVTTNPPVDDDILASSSAGWKAVALPEPARMVSLPEIDSLPSVDEVKPSSERKSKKELKAERTSASKIAKEAIAVETSGSIPVLAMASPAPAPKPDIAAPPVIGARFAQQQKSKSRTGLYAALGFGLAAAAGVGWYVSTQMKTSDSSNQVVAAGETRDLDEGKMQAQTAPAAAPAAGSATVTAIAEPTQPTDPKADDVATGMVAGGAAPGGDEAKPDDASAPKRPASKSGAKHDKKREEVEKPAPAEKKPELPKDVTKGEGKKAEGDGEPSFDALLKEAGVQDKKPVKVALEKKSLSGADIKKGMSSIGAKAQACYAGQQGTAQVKLTVAPDGTVQKVAVTGVFAGTPVGACVSSAVKGATFPAWEGGPQSFGYSYLLAE